MGTTAISALPAHADTSRATAATSASSDPRYRALAQAESTDQPVTVDSLTTSDSQTQALPDGTLATTTTAMPTRMQNASGTWEDIDPTLEVNADGSISTTATPNGLTLSAGGTGPVITATDQAGHSLALSLPTALPAPTLDGASATYTNVYPGISLTVTAQPSGGFSEVFSVSDPSAEAQAQSLKFTTQLSGLSMSQASDGGMTVTDPSTGQTVMSAPPAVMWDSATTGAPAPGVSDEFETVTGAASSTAGPGTSADTGALPITDTSNTLALNGSASNLDTSSPTYPLYLDPTWTEPYQSGGTQAYDEFEEGSSCSGYENYNNVTQPGVGDVSTNTACPGPYESYFQIDTSNVINPSYDIVSATLKINEEYSALDNCGEGSEQITIYSTGPISKDMDWSTRPAHGQSIISRALESDGNGAGTMCTGGVVAGDFNVASGIALARTNNWSNWTFAMVATGTVGSNSLERFNNNPSIYTVYDIPPNTPGNLAATPAPIDSTRAVHQDCDNTSPGYLGVSNLGGQHIATLSATLTSAVAAAQMQGVFTFTDSTANTTNTYTTAGYVTSGANVSIQTPALTDGHQYAWSLHSTDQYYPSPQSATCHFIVDQTPPSNPAASSTDFPALGSSTKPTKHYGQNGTFTLTSTDPAPTTGTASGLKGFYYSLDEPANGTTANSVSYIAASSGSATITIAPTHWGTSTLYVQAVDNADNLSSQTQYSFYVPWDPAATVTPGDIDGDGVPDLLTTTPGGNLVEYPGNTDTTTAPITLGTTAQSPDATPWTNYQTSHDGSFQQKAVDDLWAFNTTSHNLYLYKNNGAISGAGYNFNSTSNVGKPITKAEVASDAYQISPAGTNLDGSTACYATANFPNACTAGNYNDTDWTTTTQVIASPDLYANSPTTSLDSKSPGLITVESNGILWYYQGQSSLDYIGTAIELSGLDFSSDTVMSPVIVDGTLVLWARNNTTGTISQYPIDYDTSGYPYLGAATTLTIPSSPDLTAGNYPHIYAQVLHATTSTDYPDLIVQNTNGQVSDYPGTAPDGSLPTFAAPEALGQTADLLSAAYQDTSGNLHTYTAAGTNTPGIVMAANSSPSTAALPTGGYATAYRSTDSNGDLEIYNSATGTITNTGEGIYHGTSPSIAISAASVIEVAFQANNTDLYVYNASSGKTTNTGYGMETGTSPSFAATPAGDFKTVFQTNSNKLWAYDATNASTVVTTYGMQPGTNPAIAASDDGSFAAVFQANTTDLWDFDPITGTGTATTKGMMSTSSPAIAANPAGFFETAFQANSGKLFTWDYNLDSALVSDIQLMNQTTNPSVTGEPDGTFRVGIQTSTGTLYIYNPNTQTGTDTGQAMGTGTSPSLAD